MKPKRAPEDGTEVRSLDQIKSLNSIKDVDEQLRVAQRLCNHAHRSDMILRWLLTKLLDLEYASRPASWQLFTQCIRLIQPSLLASRLKAVEILILATKALSQSQASLLLALDDALATLLAINKQLVAGATTAAAEFFAEWLRQLRCLRLTSETDIARLYLTGQQIWDLRRDADDEPFVELCLLPAAVLLAELRSTRNDVSRKRNRDGVPDQTGTALLLERLIAKHVFIKSRASFLRAKDQDTSNEAVGLIRLQVESLVRQITEALPHESVHGVYSALLNVAIRCGTITRQRQALAEVAWYDAVFAEMTTQIVSFHSPQEIRLIIQDMLSVVKERSTLSLPLLRKVVAEHAALQSAEPAWKMVQLVTSMNSTTFNREESFQQLAMALEQAPGELDEMRQTVIDPLVDSFAQDRRLLEFVSLWQQRLEQSDSRIDSIWDHLDNLLESRLEQVLTAQQITGAFKARCQDLQSMIKHKATNSSAQQQAIAARCCILSAFLRGVGSDNLEIAVLPEANALYAQLNTIAKAAATLPSFWRLALRLFEMCGPRWLLDTDQTSMRTQEIIKGNLVKYATKQAKSKSSDDASLQAVIFLGKVLELIAADGDDQAAAGKLFEELRLHAGHHMPYLLICYPALFHLLSSEDLARIQDAVTHHHADLSAAVEDAAIIASPAIARKLDNLSSMIDLDNGKRTAESLARFQRSDSKRQNAEEVAEALLSATERKSSLKGVQTHELITTMLGIELETEQRSYLSQSDCLALCQATSRLALDSNAFQQALSLLDIAARKSIKLHGQSTDVTSLTKQIIATTSDAIKEIAQDEDPQVTVSALTLLTAVICASEDTKLPVREQDSFQTMLAKVCLTLTTLLEKTQQAMKQTQPSLVQSTILSSALRATQPVLVALGDRQASVSHATTIHKLAALIMTETTPSTETDLSASALTHPAVRAYEVLCSSQSPDAVLLAHAASRLLSAPFTFADKYIIKQAYTQLAASIPTASRLLVTQSLLAKNHKDTTAADLAVLQSTLEVQQKITLQPEQLTILTSSLLQVTVLTQHEQALVSQAALRCLSHITRHNGYLLNQHTVDEALHIVQSLAKPSHAEILIFPELCNTMTALLLTQRARLNNRFHLVLPALQALLRRLLAPPPRDTGPVFKLTSRHAHSFARVLTLLCDPPQQKRRSNEQINLVDEARRVRAYVGSFVPVLIHSYCSLVLKTPPRPEIKEALSPGLWAAMTAMEIGEPECMSILGSAMNDSERSILRTLVDEWRVGTKRSGR